MLGATVWSPEELRFQHSYLTLGQIHSALAYYWDHQEELDADIERRWPYADEARQQAGPGSREIQLGIIMDYDTKGRIVVIEVLSVSKRTRLPVKAAA